MAFETQITREGLSAGPNMHNRKPFRTASQKVLARKMARQDDDGAWRSDAPISFHPDPKKSKGQQG